MVLSNLSEPFRLNLFGFHLIRTCPKFSSSDLIESRSWHKFVAFLFSNSQFLTETFLQCPRSWLRHNVEIFSPSWNFDQATNANYLAWFNHFPDRFEEFASVFGVGRTVIKKNVLSWQNFDRWASWNAIGCPNKLDLTPLVHVKALNHKNEIILTLKPSLEFNHLASSPIEAESDSVELLASTVQAGKLLSCSIRIKSS
jgi:hypothetical protein